MSDSGKFVNTYIETAIGSLHEYLSVNLQLKTQLKLSNELVQEKDQYITKLVEENEQIINEKESDAANTISERERTITSLKSELDISKSENNELNNLRQKNASLEESYNIMAQRVSHMDTMASGFNEVKQRLVEKNTQFDNMATELEQLRQQLVEKDNLIRELEKELKPFRKDTKVVKPKKTTTNKAEEIIEPVPVEPVKVEAPTPKKGAIRLSQLKVQKEEADDF